MNNRNIPTSREVTETETDFTHFLHDVISSWAAEDEDLHVSNYGSSQLLSTILNTSYSSLYQSLSAAVGSHDPDLHFHSYADVTPSPFYQSSLQVSPLDTHEADLQASEGSFPEMEKEPTEKINGTQKNIVEGTFRFIFDALAELKPTGGIKFLTAITTKDLSSEDKAEFKKHNVWDSLKQARKIFFDAQPEQLLNLTSRNSGKIKVTKEGVQNYILELIEQEKREALNKSAKHIQFWYRRTRDENKILTLIKDKEKSPLANSIISRRV